MTLYTYPKLTRRPRADARRKGTRLTDANQDIELIRLWISQKSVTTQKTYITISRQFLTFAGKELENIKLEDVLLWLELMLMSGCSPNLQGNNPVKPVSLISPLPEEMLL